MNDPTAYVYHENHAKNTINFRRFGVKKPRPSETISDENCSYFYRTTRPLSEFETCLLVRPRRRLASNRGQLLLHSSFLSSRGRIRLVVKCDPLIL